MNRPGNFLATSAARLLGRLPVSMRDRLAQGVGRILFLGWRSRRRMAIYWSSRALGFPEDDRRTRRVAAQSFVNFVKFTLEFLASAKFQAQEQVQKLRQVHNAGVVDEIGRREGGCLFLTGHIGNWELLGSWLALRAQPKRRFYVVVRPLEVDCLDEIAQDIRRSHGFRTVETIGGARDVLRALKAGDWVAALVDRPVHAVNERVEFLGKVGSHPVGIARLAQRAGTPVVMGACWNNGSGGFEAEILAPIEPGEFADGEGAVQLVAANLEQMVRRRPDQWYIAYTSGPRIDIS